MNKIQLFKFWFWCAIVLNFLCFAGTSQSLAQSKPNILWITCEDLNTMLGSYGDPYASTPFLDQLAEEGLRFTHAYANAPVCSPARSTLITGIYTTSMGTQHLRSEVRIPDEIKTLPHYLRQAGYYCTNNDKEDYNFEEVDFWDESSQSAHWRNRPEDKPFFSVFNIGTTHQSQIFGSDEAFYEKYGKQLTASERQSPDEIQVPPYFFDTPVTRKMWARYYDLVTLMDKQVGQILQQLKEDGLEENTIVFFFADHGTGMPRSKRALYDSGLKVPFILKAPPKYQKQYGLGAGSVEDRLVSFVDFAPTLLSILDLEIPANMQGTPFLGTNKASEPAYVYTTADRVDEAFEVARSVRNQQFSYVRNYYPHLPLIQPNYYTDKSEVMVELYRALSEGQLTEAQQGMWQSRRPLEELYELQNDPHEVHNLAGDPAYQDVLHQMRKAQQQWAIQTHDTGMIPEPLMHKLAANSTIYETAKSEEKAPYESIMSTTDLMFAGKKAIPLLEEKLKDKNPVVRYWAVVGLQVLGQEAKGSAASLSALLNDPFPTVSIQAAEALCAIGQCEESLPYLFKTVKEQEGPTRLMASRALEMLGSQLSSSSNELQALQEHLCQLSAGKWYGYDLYACWSLTQALNKLNL